MDAIDLNHGHAMTERFIFHPDEPLSARVEIEQHATFERGEWSPAIRTTIRFSGTASAFSSSAGLVATESDRTVFSKVSERGIPRGFL
ncbi:hypothetical protein [Planctomycetes bacterium Poly30]